MKTQSRLIAIPLVVVMVCTILLPVEAFGQGEIWQTVGEAGFSTGNASYIAKAIDSSGTPYVVYCDGGNGNRATAMKYDGSNWEPVGVPGFSDGNVICTSIAIDSSGTPYVVYQDGGNGYKSTVMRYSGSNWETMGVPGFSSGGADNPTIVIDSSGTLYVAYRDEHNGDRATVMKYDGSEWETVGKTGFSAGAAYNVSIAIDSLDTPYVVYTDVGNGYKATVMKYNGSEWKTVGETGFSAGAAFITSIAIDNKDIPYVAFSDGDKDSKATVMKYNGSEWETVGDPGFSDSGMENKTSIAINSSGTPYVAYLDRGNCGKATVMKYEESKWKAVGEVGFSAGAVGYISIALDSGDTPYVVYRDEGNGNRATVMKAIMPAQTALAEADTDTPMVGEKNLITLKVMYSAGGIDTTFSGEKAVTITGVEEAPDGSYGSFNQQILMGSLQTVLVNFDKGIATANLSLNKGTEQRIGFKIHGVTTPDTNTLTITPVNLPTPPPSGAFILRTPVPGDRQVHISWSAVEDTVGYEIYHSTNPGNYTAPSATVTASVYNHQVTGLTNGTTYYFIVKATQANGDRESSNEVSATPSTVPAAPTNVTATAGNGRATVTFTPPVENGGNPITGYVVTSNPGNLTVTGTGTSITITGLSNGTTYTFTVKAINSMGGSLPSVASNAVKPSNPSNGGSTGGGSRTQNLTIGKSNPTNGVEGEHYSYSFTATGGSGDYSFAVTSGALPEGLILSKDGVISGTPTKAGIYQYNITVTDRNGRVVNHRFTLVIEEDKVEATKQETPEGERTPKKQIRLTIGKLETKIEDTTYLLDAIPFVDSTSKRTLVPLKFISEALGATVTWLPETEQVLIIEGDTKILLTIGSKEVLVNGEMILIDTEPRIMPPGRTFVPLRFVSQILGATVEYDEATREITIIR